MNPKTKAKSKRIDPLKQLKQLEDKYVRALADYQNLEKRIQSQQSEFIRFASATLIDKLLPVLDDLERAQSSLKDKGLNLVVDQFKKTLKSEGVEEIKALNQTFDPTTMDAQELVKGPKNRVIKITIKGYTLNGKVLRPAKVHVGQG